MTTQELVQELYTDLKDYNDSPSAIDCLMNKYCIIESSIDTGSLLEDILDNTFLPAGTLGLMIMPTGGYGKARSTKIINVQINWKKLFDEGVDGYLSIAGALATHYLIPLAALSVSRKLYKLSTIEVDERHAMVLACLWTINDSETATVSTTNRIDKVNQYLIERNRVEIDETEYNTILDELKKLKSIDFNSDGSILLKEKVEFRY